MPTDSQNTDPEPCRVTLRDIAKRLGFSHSTISRALNNHPSIPHETCLKIQAVAREMGYRRNALIATLTSQLRMSRSVPYQATLAFVTNYREKNEWKVGPANLRFYEGALARAHHLGYKLEEFWLKEFGPDSLKASRVLRNRGIRGLLIAPLRDPLENLSLEWSQFAVATIGHSMVAPRLHSAQNHHHHALSLALRKLRHRGYRRVGLVLMPLSDHYSDGTFTSRYLYHWLPSAQEQMPEIFCQGGQAADFNEAHFRKWLKSQKPDAIICMGHQVHEWVSRLKIRVPEELGVVDLDIHDTRNGWSGIDMREEEVAAAAVDLVVQQLQHTDFGIPSAPRTVLLEGRWIEGKTLLSKAT